MPRNIVDLSARSGVFRAQPLLSHAWVASPAEVLLFVQNPRSELKKLGIRLPSTCRIETVLENHDWLSGHTNGLLMEGGINVFCRGQGDGQSVYRVAFYASKSTGKVRDRTLLHSPHEEEKPSRRTSQLARLRAEESRRSMLATNLHLQVHQWLAPLTISGPITKSAQEAHRIFTGITRAVAGLVPRSSTLQAGITEIVPLLQRPYNPGYSLLFRTNRHAGTPFHAATVGVLYAKALWVLQTSGYHFDALIADALQLLSEPSQPVRILVDTIRSLDADFIAHASVEATIRRGQDPLFDARLTEAEQLFARHFPQHPDRCPRFFAPARGLELFTESRASEWWFLPGLIALAVSVWPTSAQLQTTKR